MKFRTYFFVCLSNDISKDFFYFIFEGAMNSSGIEEEIWDKLCTIFRGLFIYFSLPFSTKDRWRRAGVNLHLLRANFSSPTLSIFFGDALKHALRLDFIFFAYLITFSIFGIAWLLNRIYDEKKITFPRWRLDISWRLRSIRYQKNPFSLRYRWTFFYFIIV